MNETPRTAISRRSVTRAAVWSAPAIALVAAAPAFAASQTDIGAFVLNGTCGTPGVLGPGFTLLASGAAPVPVGTTLLVTGSGVANIGVWSVTGGTATVAVLSGTSRLITVTSPLPAGAMMAFRTTLSTSVSFRLNGLVTLPDGYDGTGAKSSGTVTSTLLTCTGS